MAAKGRKRSKTKPADPITQKQAEKRLQVALVELQTMGFVQVNATTVIKNSLFYSDLE